MVEDESRATPESVIANDSPARRIDPPRPAGDGDAKSPISRTRPALLVDVAPTSALTPPTGPLTEPLDGGPLIRLELGRPPSDFPTDTNGNAFEQRLIREILISERFRVTLLALFPGILMLLVLAAGALSPDLLSQTLRLRLDRLRVGLFLAGVSIYEFSALRSVQKLIQSGKQSTPLRRYVNAFIETTMPTCVVMYYMTVVGPLPALFLPHVFTYFVFILLSTLRLDFALSVFTGFVAAIEYAALSLFAIASDTELTLDPSLSSIPHHVAKAAILLVSGVAAGFVAQRLRKSFVNTLRSIEDRNRIVNVFGQHVTPAVVERLIVEGTETRSEEREVCVMFVDVRNFTAMSENKSPSEVVGYLNSLFDPMIESVNKHNGIVNKFLGDGFMAIFGAPLAEGNQARNAVLAARELLDHLRVRVAKGSIAPTRIGIGVHIGKVVIGNVGSRTRKEYTVIGDVVNVASRVEALNKELGSQLLATEEVWDAADLQGICAIPRAPLTVRGRKAPIKVYELG
jgi:adenylate cyclase